MPPWRRVLDGSAIGKALDYSLNHWVGLGRFLLDGEVPIDNNHVENRIRPWALGRRNWLFIGSQLAGERAAVVMSLLQSALCRARHKADYAEHRTMPSGLVFPGSRSAIGSA